MNVKYDFIKKIDDDNCRFVISVLDSYNKKNSQYENNLKTTSINKEDGNIVIDLDQIWSKPFFYTNIRLKLTQIVDIFNNTSFDRIKKNPKRFCKTITNFKVQKNFTKPSNCINIIEFIKTLDVKQNTKYKFIAKEINEENLFKEDQLKKAINALKITNRKEQISYIYDEICNYLNSDFIQNHYCNFINNKCVAQRHLNFYPINSKNGCCFRELKKCKHLKQNGTCNVECLACRLFSCPYLSKKGIGYWANEFVLLEAFLTKEQRKHLVFDFYKPKEYIIDKIIELENN